jgi:hypothetical protein
MDLNRDDRYWPFSDWATSDVGRKALQAERLRVLLPGQRPRTFRMKFGVGDAQDDQACRAVERGTG